jgi:hypothetical protein
MKVRALLILLVLISMVVPLFYLYRGLLRSIRPRESAARFFLFLFAVFVLIVLYTIIIVGIVLRIFPR